MIIFFGKLISSILVKSHYITCIQTGTKINTPFLKKVVDRIFEN